MVGKRNKHVGKKATSSTTLGTRAGTTITIKPQNPKPGRRTRKASKSEARRADVQGCKLLSRQSEAEAASAAACKSNESPNSNSLAFPKLLGIHRVF
jgi:hypothetical protein